MFNPFLLSLPIAVGKMKTEKIKKKKGYSLIHFLQQIMSANHIQGSELKFQGNHSVRKVYQVQHQT